MELAVAYLDEALSHIRAGKANPKLLDGIRVDYYGSSAPISNVANISVPDARTITITPWEKSMFKEIEKAIINSELGVMPEKQRRNHPSQHTAAHRRTPQTSGKAEQSRSRDSQSVRAQCASRRYRRSKKP